MEPGIPLSDSGLKAGRFGRLDLPQRAHGEVGNDKFTPLPPDTFGIQDDEIVSFLEALGDRQVAVVVAGTGSGKSTFLPWRLLVPPAPFPEDHLTRYGQIVVTQPRIEASTGIPQFVAEKLHGSRAGPGTDIGFINSKNKDRSDPRNKLVYLTDGTLVNMIRRGSLHEVSVVMIDEAHERSLNIDLILALLRRELRGLPHLKVLIVSATIDTSVFKDFFEPDFRVLIQPMKSKTIHPVYERWWAGPELPEESWPAEMPTRAAQTVAEILRWMVKGDHPNDIDPGLAVPQGDVLVFLTGKRPIERAIRETRELIDADPDLLDANSSIELVPLYGELPERERRRPFDSERRPKRIRYRVVYSTNLAETSLTIDGIRHVVDTGLIKRKSWDPLTATESFVQVRHSQHGLHQRRGRAGRTASGVWHCLFTEPQFKKLDVSAPPVIANASLSKVLLATAVAGVADPRSLKWLAPGPPAGEVDRALAALRGIGAIDQDGDPTPLGREVAGMRAEFEDAAILVAADQAGCVVEAATVLAAKSKECRNEFLAWSQFWPAEAKLHVDSVHEAYLSSAVDDADVVCRLMSGWEAHGDPVAQAEWARRHFVDAIMMQVLGRERLKLLQPLMTKTRSTEVRPVDLRLLPRLRAAIAWANPNSLYSVERRESGDERDSLVGELMPTAGPRSDLGLLKAMHEGRRPVIDESSWVSRHLRPGTSHLILLNRETRNRYLTPLAPPETVLSATFVIAVEPSQITTQDDLLATVARVPLAEARRPLQVLPGDRFLADVVTSDSERPFVRLLSRLDPIPDPTVEIVFEGDDDGGQEDGPSDLSDELGDRQVAAIEEVIDDEETDQDDEGDDEDLDGVVDAHDSMSIDDSILDLDAVLDMRRSKFNTDGAFPVMVAGVQPDGRLVCTPDDRMDLFLQFVFDHIGHEVTLDLEHVRVFARDRQPILMARHQPTELSIPIDPRHIGTGLRYSQIRDLEQGARWTFRLDGADEGRLLLELSQTPQTLGSDSPCRRQEASQSLC
jgi:HrpA-like RNA helicase